MKLTWLLFLLVCISCSENDLNVNDTSSDYLFTLELTDTQNESIDSIVLIITFDSTSTKRNVWYQDDVQALAEPDSMVVTLEVNTFKPFDIEYTIFSDSLWSDISSSDGIPLSSSL